MASEEGLRILLQGEVSSFISAMRAATDAVNAFASNLPNTASELNNVGNAANRAARDVQNSAEAAARAAGVYANLGARFQNIDQLSEALATLRRRAAGAQTFGGLQEFNRQIQLLEREIFRLRSTGQIEISARFDNAPRITRDIQQAQAALHSFVAEARSTNFQFNTLSRAPNAAGQSLNRFRSQAGNAGGALIGLTRIAQDAPFGFIAIQNNLTELFGAFQQLSRQTGSAAAAFRSLGSALLGAGGIGLAFSVLTSVITFLVQKYGSLGNAMEAIFGTITDQQKAAKALSESLKGAGDAYVKAATDVGTLREEIRLAKDGFLDKDKVVKHYNDTIGKTVGSVKNLEEAERSLQKNAEAYIRFTLLKAAANQAQQKAAEKALQAELERSKTDEQSSSFIFSGLKNSKDSAVLADYSKFAKQNREKAAAESEKDQKTFEDIARKFQDQAAALAKTFNFDFFGGDNGGKDAKTTSDILKELNQQLTAINTKFAATGGSAQELGNELQNAYEKALEGLSKIGITTDSEVFKSIKSEIERIQSFVKLPGNLQAPAIQIPIKIEPLPKVNTTPIERSISGIQKIIDSKFFLLSDELGRTINGKIKYSIEEKINALSQSLAGVGDIIGAVLSPGGGIQSAISGFASIIAGFLQKVGEDMIRLGVIMLGIKKGISLSFNNPYVAIAAGVAAVAAASFVRSSIQSDVPHFATGGMVNGPTLAMVGDNPSGIEYMLPKEVLDKLDGGGGAYIAETRISGSDLVILFNKASREGNR